MGLYDAEPVLNQILPSSKMITSPAQVQAELDRHHAEVKRQQAADAEVFVASIARSFLKNIQAATRDLELVSRGDTTLPKQTQNAGTDRVRVVTIQDEFHSLDNFLRYYRAYRDTHGVARGRLCHTIDTILEIDRRAAALREQGFWLLRPRLSDDGPVTYFLTRTTNHEDGPTIHDCRLAKLTAKRLSTDLLAGGMSQCAVDAVVEPLKRQEQLQRERGTVGLAILFMVVLWPILMVPWFWMPVSETLLAVTCWFLSVLLLTASTAVTSYAVAWWWYLWPGHVNQ